MNAPLQLVLDTNVVLDCWLFDDRRLQRFRSALDNGNVVVLRSLLTHDELQRVLAYPKLRLDVAKQAQVLAEYGARTLPAVLPCGFAADCLMLPPGFPRCRDGDDQHFLALCYHSQAALISRDAALLRLRGAAARYGVAILDPTGLHELLAAAMFD